MLTQSYINTALSQSAFRIYNCYIIMKYINIKGAVSPPERCDLDGVKLEKVHELFQVCRSCIKGVTFYTMPQYVLLYDQKLCNYH